MPDEPNVFESLVSADNMPPCPLCGKALALPFKPMVFRAHGMAALAHDECKPEQEHKQTGEVVIAGGLKPVSDVPLGTPTHKYRPNRKYPWFCADCGYPEHEKLKHS